MQHSESKYKMQHSESKYKMQHSESKYKMQHSELSLKNHMANRPSLYNKTTAITTAAT